MEAARGGEVRGNVFVTRETELALAAAIAPVVALAAVFLEFGVRSAQLARHEQRLRIHGLSTPRREEAHDEDERP